MTARAAEIRESEVRELEAYFDRLWPLLRSLTGDGVRETVRILSEIVPFRVIEAPTGMQCFDWTVPPEWRVREAWIAGPDGKRVLDLQDNNLHLVNYSTAFRGRLSRAELDGMLHSLPDQPDAVPYVTSYYRRRWGFCLSQRRRDALPDGDYEVCIDAEHVDGSLTLADAVLPGESDDEILLTSYDCHPSMANNELSGMLGLTFLYRRIAAWPSRRYTYRFVLAPETIGALAYLSLKGEHLKQRVKAGYIITCIGAPGGDPPVFTYKSSRRGDALSDRAARAVLPLLGPTLFETFNPADGSDERQYCSPGFDLPMGSLMRAMYGRYPEYHTSLDDKSIMSFPALSSALDAYEAMLRAVETNRRYRNLAPHGEPQLGRRGLYGHKGNWVADHVGALLWTLQYSDGRRDLLDVAALSGLSPDALAAAAARGVEAGLLEPCDDETAKPPPVDTAIPDGGPPLPAAALPYLAVSFSQEGEDRVLMRLFEADPPRSKFYVDVGAHHPYRFSNTYAFYRLGWRGINIDAAPGSSGPFLRFRPRDITLEHAVSNRTETVRLDVFNEPALNTIRPERTASMPAHYRVVARHDLQPRTLADILDEHAPPGVEIDLLTVDVECEDLAALMSNDWEKHRPRYVVVEDRDLSLAPDRSSPIADYLSGSGYELLSKLHISCIWRRRDA